MGTYARTCCLLLLSLAFLACSESRLVVSECLSTGDCPTDQVCEDGQCVPGFTPNDGDTPDGDTEDGDLDDAPPLPDGDSSDEVPDGDGDGELPPDPEDGDQDRIEEPEEELPIPPGNDCGSPLVLPLDTPTFGTTLGATDTLNPACDAPPMTGGDVIYRLTLDAGDDVRITIAPASEGFNPAIYLLDACANDAVCLDVADEGRGGESDNLSFHSPQGGDVFLVVDSVLAPDRSGGLGDFMIAARRYPPVAECHPCGEELPDCGATSGCVEFFDGDGIVERACVPRCTEDSDCQQGFACRTARVLGGDSGLYCMPKYGYSSDPKHALATCGALLDMGTPCNWRLVGNNDGACGADDARAVNDAVCIFFPALTDLVSYCTIHCVDDSECPQGYFCYKMPWPSPDRVCKIR